MVLREGMTVIFCGTAIGAAMALGGARIVRHKLYGPASRDTVAYAAAGCRRCTAVTRKLFHICAIFR